METMKEYTDTLVCGVKAMIARENNERLNVFDWYKAAAICHALKDEYGDDYKNISVEACLAEDCGNTCGMIVENGEIPDDRYGRPYLASIWATPMMTVIYCDREKNEYWEKEYECIRKDNPFGWDASTFWPEQVMEIYNR